MDDLKYTAFSKLTDFAELPLNTLIQVIVYDEHMGVGNEYEIVPAIFNGKKVSAYEKPWTRIPLKIILAWRCL